MNDWLIFMPLSRNCPVEISLLYYQLHCLSGVTQLLIQKFRSCFQKESWHFKASSSLDWKPLRTSSCLFFSLKPEQWVCSDEKMCFFQWSRYPTGHKMWLKWGNHHRVGVFAVMSCQSWTPFFDIFINYGGEHRNWFSTAGCWPKNCRSGYDRDKGLAQVYTSNLIFYISAIIIYIFLYIGNEFLKSPWKSAAQLWGWKVQHCPWVDECEPKQEWRNHRNVVLIIHIVIKVKKWIRKCDLKSWRGPRGVQWWYLKN